jgi:hypothetical protein
MTLRGRFGMEVTRRYPKKFWANIKKVLDTPEMFQTLSKLYR